MAAAQIKNNANQIFLMYSDINAIPKVPFKRKDRSEVPLSHNQNNQNPKHVVTQWYYMLYKKDIITGHKYMLHSSEIYFGTLSYQLSLKEGMRGKLGKGGESFNKFHQSDKQC